MTEQPDNTDICLVSSIIKDGIKNYEELEKKFAACKSFSLDQARERIQQMKDEGKVGYYHSKYSVTSGAIYYYFTKWAPEMGSFPESKDYRDGKSYYKPYFRASK